MACCHSAISKPDAYVYSHMRTCVRAVAYVQVHVCKRTFRFSEFLCSACHMYHESINMRVENLGSISQKRFLKRGIHLTSGGVEEIQE